MFDMIPEFLPNVGRVVRIRGVCVENDHCPSSYFRLGAHSPISFQYGMQLLLHIGPDFLLAQFLFILFFWLFSFFC